MENKDLIKELTQDLVYSVWLNDGFISLGTDLDKDNKLYILITVRPGSDITEYPKTHNGIRVVCKERKN